ncbi:uncharacterized [Tachysurus ichikawai]
MFTSGLQKLAFRTNQEFQRRCDEALMAVSGNERAATTPPAWRTDGEAAAWRSSTEVTVERFIWQKPAVLAEQKGKCTEFLPSPY